MIDFRQAVKQCHRCDQRKVVNGHVLCAVDDHTPNRHALAMYCPHESGPKFGTAEKPQGWDDVQPWIPPAPEVVEEVAGVCERCGGAHDVSACPIPEGYVATAENATAGRCCS
jgi:hypothetical protein